MGEWVIGALINILGSVVVNFGTNLLKLAHNQQERLAMLGSDGGNGKLVLKPIIYSQTWRVGILIFAMGNCLNFVSFGYAAQSLLAALGSVQFVSNIVFAYFVLNKTVTGKVLLATAFIVLGNIFLVAFGNHQSPVYTPEQLAEKYSNIVFLIYCIVLMLIVAVNHSIYRRGEFLSISGHDLSPHWHMLLPFSFATVSGAVGSCSVLFAKSLSNMLRLTMASNFQLHAWFTYSMLLLLLTTAWFWMARLNEGLSLFDAILIVPMFQISWTFFSICTGFVYFQEYQVFDALRTMMFLLGMTCIFIGISLLAPDGWKGGEAKDSSSLASPTTPSIIATDINSFAQLSTKEMEINDMRSFRKALLTRLSDIVVGAKTACKLSLGLGEDSINASSAFVMPMVISRMVGFRRTNFDLIRFFPLKSHYAWSKISMDEDDNKILGTS